MERRKSERIRKRYSVSLNGNQAIVDNLSNDGIRLTTSIVPTERKVNITFQVNDQSFDVSGVVLWAKKLVSVYKQYQLGISLTNATYEYYQLIDKPL